jgi:serine/threonine protein kinase/cephalosporin-C deacetylase-like acetyl esterase
MQQVSLLHSGDIMGQTLNDPAGGRLGDFEIVREIGRGGMGVVYEARQVSLNRKVALKVLAGSLGLTAKSVQRFHLEAEAAARLHHTNIVPVYATGEQNGTYFYAMELIDGPSLDLVIQRMAEEHRPSPPVEATTLAVPDGPGPGLGQTVLYRPTAGDPCRQPAGTSEPNLRSGTSYFETVARLIAGVADALAYAHEQGVIHRDIKPSNLLLSPDGRLSINDFGLARLLEQPGMTLTGEFVGSPRYMSPEQIAVGRIPLDHRTDIYSLGATLYELLTLQPAFSGERRDQLLAQILQKEPSRPRKLDKRIPVDLETICLKALEKDPDRRYQTAGALAEDLRRYLGRFAIAARRPGPVTRLAKFVRRHRIGVAATAGILVLSTTAGILGWKYRSEQVQVATERQHVKDEQWVREEALPQIRRFVDEWNFGAAFELAEEAERRVPGDPSLAELLPLFSAHLSVNTRPTGAEVYVKPYNDARRDWRHVGVTPLNSILLPAGLLHFKILKEGYAPVEGCRHAGEERAEFVLDKADTVPPDMVRVSGNQYRASLTGVEGIEAINLDDFFIDRHEVTNRQFKAFIDGGGYQKREYWKHPFVSGSTTLSWDEAVRHFRDATGAPAPANWRSGSYPPGEEDYPVRGISWYEAAAYAEFAGKSLPTVAHWTRASARDYALWVVPASNMSGTGPARVGFFPGLGPFGTYDMAGNLKEWCWNKAGGDKRYSLGGTWRDPGYMFFFANANAAFDRSDSQGFRCVKLLSGTAPTRAMANIALQPPRDYRNAKPAPDEKFLIYKSLYSYDRSPLHSQTVAREETNDWIHETIQFDAAYGSERITAHLYLPRHVKPPYQTVVHFPGLGARYERVFPGREWSVCGIPQVVRGGRAVLWPIYKGTYERGFNNRPGANSDRDFTIQLAKDLRRSVDYIAQRSDIDHSRLAYFGFSWGGNLGTIMVAVEDRFKVAVMSSGGFPLNLPRPEIDRLNFAPHITIPVLMINGKKDWIFPVELSQQPMYDSLGTDKKDKRHILLDTGHLVPADAVAQELHGWLDRYLGPVQQSSK